MKHEFVVLMSIPYTILCVRGVESLRRLKVVKMKQNTTPEQTAKLIELGFEKPKMAAPALKWVDGEPTFEPQYTIGELIKMLPKMSSKHIRYVATKRAWIADVDVLGKQGRCHRGAYYKELIDALFDMIVKLKEEGVI